MYQEELLARSKMSIAQGSLTNSKHPDRFSDYVPTHIDSGYECHLIDCEGNRWIDFICGLGTNLFGYGNKEIVAEQMKHMYKGSCHSLPTSIEVYASEKVKELFPFVEKVKFVNDGSSACTAACEIARLYTGKEYILTEGYHGWHPEQINPVAWNKNAVDFKIKSLSSDLDNIDWSNVACVIVEPIQLDNSRNRIEWLKKLRKITKDNRVVLIYDEVITGIRYYSHAVSKHYGEKPDLLLLGKAIANGEKIALVCGSKYLLDQNYFCSGTYHGHYLSLATLIKCIDLVQKVKKFDIEKLNMDSLFFKDRLNKFCKDVCEVSGWGSRCSITGDKVHLFFQEMAKNKILFGPSLFFNFHNIEYIEIVCGVADLVCQRIRNGVVKYEGLIPTPAFSSRSRNNA